MLYEVGQLSIVQSAEVVQFNESSFVGYHSQLMAVAIVKIVWLFSLVHVVPFHQV